MKSLTIAVIFYLLSGYYCQKCVGGKATSLPDGCRVIEKKELVIDSENNVKELKEKLKSVKTILAGMKVSRNSFGTFDFLENVVSISNSNGPAIEFRENKNLKRVLFPKLVSLRGVPNEVHFLNDHFIHAAFQNSESMQDLQILQKASMKGHKGRKKDEFFAILDEPPFDWIFWALLVSNIILFLYLLFASAYFLHNSKCLRMKEVSDGKGSSEEQKEAQKTSKPSEGLGTEKSTVEQKTTSNIAPAPSERTSLSSQKTANSKVETISTKQTVSNKTTKKSQRLLDLPPKK